MANLVICGDSFNIGIGCYDLTKEPYGCLLSESLELNQINLAKGSSTNFSIYLQAKYAVEKISNIDLAIVSVTSYNRVEWFYPNENPVNNRAEVNNTDVNYHEYPPYGPATYFAGLPDQPYDEIILENPMELDREYHPTLYTENYAGILDHLDIIEKNIPSQYYYRFKNHPIKNFEILRDYFLYIYNERIERMHDIGIITLAHNLLKNAGIRHLILADDDGFKPHINNENYLHLSWGDVSIKHPDTLPSWHTSPAGHRLVYDTIVEKIKQNGWYQ